MITQGRTVPIKLPALAKLMIHSFQLAGLIYQGLAPKKQPRSYGGGGMMMMDSQFSGGGNRSIWKKPSTYGK